MSTIRGWWEEDRAVTQKFYNQELALPGSAPEQCEPWVNEAIVVQHLASPAIWSIFQLQDLLGLDEQLRRKNPAEERINVPADPKHFWGYRMHLTLEELGRAEGFNRRLKELVAQHGRDGRV
jgi:4-alpha-glucanotransferase